MTSGPGCSRSPNGASPTIIGAGEHPQLAVLTDEAASPDAVDGTFEDIVIENLSTDRAIEALVRDLSADQAEVVLLRVLADLSVDQVAKIMGRSPGSVRVSCNIVLCGAWRKYGIGVL